MVHPITPWISTADKLPGYELPVLFASPGEKRQHWIIRFGYLHFSDKQGHHFHPEPTGISTNNYSNVEYWRPLEPLMQELLSTIFHTEVKI